MLVEEELPNLKGYFQYFQCEEILKVNPESLQI